MDKKQEKQPEGIVIEDYITGDEVSQVEKTEPENILESPDLTEVDPVSDKTDNDINIENKKKAEELLKKLEIKETGVRDNSNQSEKTHKHIKPPQKDVGKIKSVNTSTSGNSLSDSEISNHISKLYTENKHVTEDDMKIKDKIRKKEESDKIKALYIKELEEYKRQKRELKNQRKELEKGFKNSYIYGFIFLVFAFILEFVNFAVLGFGVLPTNFGIEFGIILMLSGLIFIIPTEPAKIALTSILFGIQLILNLVNASLYKMCNDIVTLDMIFTLGSETLNLFELNQIDLGVFILSVIVTALFVLAIIFGGKFAPKFKINKTKKAIISLIILLLSVELMGYSCVEGFKFIYFNNTKAELVVDNNKYWSESTNNKFASFKKFGFWSFYISNAGVSLGYDRNLNKTEKDELIAFINNGADYKLSTSLYNGKNVSGALYGDNLVMIMMESAEWFAIDEFNTPELYKFINNDALKFENFYSRNKTNISEQIALLGGVPNKYSLETINGNVGIDTKYSLPNLFKASGYESVNFFHNYYKNIYSRDIINDELGFDNVYTIDDYPTGYEQEYVGDYMDDGEYIKPFLEEFMPRDKKFFSFYTTMTTHGPYTITNKRLEKYYQIFDSNYDNYKTYAKLQGWATPEKNTEEYNLIREYKCRAMSLENTFKLINSYISKPDESIKNKTTIILFADHNAYYSDLSNKVKNIDKFAKDKEQFNVPLVIYNSKLGNGNIDKFCNTYDLYPTICDLYGLSYNKNLTQGYSVFSEDIKNSIFVSWMSGAFDENYFTYTLDDYTATNKSLQTNATLVKFKDKLNSFYKKQDMIDKYYQVNFEKNYANK